MRVDQVVPAGRAGRLGPQDAVGERAQVGGQVLLRQVLERSGDHMPDQYPGGHLDAGGQVTGGGPGEHLDLDPGLGEPAGDLDDVDVHAARVAGTRLVQRGGVYGEYGDPARRRTVDPEQPACPRHIPLLGSPTGPRCPGPTGSTRCASGIFPRARQSHPVK